MKKSILKILACLLVAVNLFALTSCADTSWAVKSGKNTISAGIYLGYLVDAYYTAAYSVSDQQTDMFKQEIDGVKVDEYIRQTALTSCKKYIAIQNLFEEYNLSFTDDETEEFESEAESVWEQVSSIYEENGCGKESLFNILLAEEKYQKVFEYYYGEDGKEPLSEEARKEYFEENYAKIKYITVSYSTHFENVSTSASATDAQKTSLKEIANTYLERLNNGESIDKLIAEEEALANEDESEAQEVSDKDFTFFVKDTSDDPDEFNKAVFAQKINTPAITENDTYGYYVYTRYEIDADKDYDDYKDDVLSSMRSDEFEEIINKTIEQVKLEENDSAIKRYKPQNISLG